MNKNLKIGNKCNIDFAFDIFSEIKKYPSNNFSVITFDIKGFFDNLDHKILRDKWKDVLDTPDQLPPAHFNVFKHITRFCYVDMIDIFSMFQNKIWVNSIENNKIIRKRKWVSKLKYLKKQNSIAYCTKKEFLDNKKKLVKKTKWMKNAEGELFIKNYGIPQGSPISAVLANIYMLDFDRKINEALLKISGLYKRYSDDMIIVCPIENTQNILNLFDNEIENLKLEIQSKKTQIFTFKREEKKLFCGEQYGKTLNLNKNLLYLGFEFDGSTIRIKSATISAFYRKMKRTIKRASYYASLPNRKDHGIVFKKRIFKRFSYKGSKRRLKYLWNDKKEYFEISHHFDWGNFLSYSDKAEKIPMKNIIQQQTKKSWNKLNKLLK